MNLFQGSFPQSILKPKFDFLTISLPTTPVRPHEYVKQQVKKQTLHQRALEKSLFRDTRLSCSGRESPRNLFFSCYYLLLWTSISDSCFQKPRKEKMRDTV